MPVTALHQCHHYWQGKQNDGYSHSASRSAPESRNGQTQASLGLRRRKSQECSTIGRKKAYGFTHSTNHCTRSGSTSLAHLFHSRRICAVRNPPPSYPSSFAFSESRGTGTASRTAAAGTAFGVLCCVFGGVRSLGDCRSPASSSVSSSSSWESCHASSRERRNSGRGCGIVNS
jgi:hypothetical protein